MNGIAPNLVKHGVVAKLMATTFHGSPDASFLSIFDLLNAIHLRVQNLEAEIPELAPDGGRKLLKWKQNGEIPAIAKRRIDYESTRLKIRTAEADVQ